MPPSQLKRLKSSLREAGITGPQKSKKQKKSSTKPTNTRIARNESLQHVRDSFNPFELRVASARPAKHVHANSNGPTGKYKAILHRPGVSKSAGEQMRREKLLPELQRRNKVGGLIDRRVGEGDRGLTAEERAVQRFAAEKGKDGRRSLFDLEGSEDEAFGGGMGFGLTHGGRGLDDLPGDEMSEVGSESEGEGELVRRKRRRDSDESEEEAEKADAEGEDGQPERKRSKKEVMQEVIAKSKLHKYERQKTKEDDDDLRDQLDNSTEDMLAILKGHMPPPNPKPCLSEPSRSATGPTMNPDRQKLLDGTLDRDQVDRDYDVRLRQLAQDAKAKPSERTKTEEEKVRDEAERLRVMEERRLSRMRGEQVEEDEDEDADVNKETDEIDEAAEFGFRSAEVNGTMATVMDNEGEDEQVVLEDEDEFDLDGALIASGSELDFSDMSEADGDEDESNAKQQALDDEEDEEDEFVKDILGDLPSNASAAPKVNGTGLAYTYPCPRTHAGLLAITQSTPIEQLPTIIQRIRALHHPSLNATNKEAISDFSATLVEHVSYMGLQNHPLAITEQVIRHLHSLSRTYPERIGEAFRAQLKAAQNERKALHKGDLVTLAAIGAIYPTSDHWHQVVTPAVTLMTRWLGMNVPDTAEKRKKGAFLVGLCVGFQKLSKRVVPEALRFTLRALSEKTGADVELRQAHVRNLTAMADLWKDKSAFIELFTPALPLLPQTSRERRTLQILLQTSLTKRRPLQLHAHRPLPIRTSIPKFEEAFNPDKHYDPDRERSDARKLQNEYKRERKGALRELRKDSNFVAREGLRRKRVEDEEYSRKYRRLVAEVQGEAAQGGKEYLRERRGKAGMGRGRGRGRGRGK